MPDEVFETKVINHRPVLFPLYESNGELLVNISGKGWMTITSQSPLTTYARWDEINIRKDGVELHERSGWEEPVRGQFEIELLNVDGGELEQRVAGGQVIFLPRHIPVRVGIEMSDPLIWYSRIEIVRVWERRKDAKFPGYYVRVPTTKDIRTERPETEIFWILGSAKDQGIELPERDTPAPAEEKAFETVFKNEREQPVKVFADTGKIFFAVGAGGSALLEAYDAAVMYARYKQIVFRKDGKINLDENKKWWNPFPLSIELRNEDGAPTEGVTLGGLHINVLKGIPRYAEVRPEEPDSRYKSFTWKRVKVKAGDRSGVRAGYFEEHWEVQLLKEVRR
ncbi:MAG TPA: hypothetical protein VMW46_03245 [Candidatus Desulfaltia sp.]|nr:hypothetical protein [Candidatus Desulfaltia sp.]